MKHDTFEQIRQGGYYRGRNIASRIDIPQIGDRVRFADSTELTEITEEAEIEPFVIDWAFASETASRDFSPFEFTASALNSRDDSEEAWKQFDTGIAAGILDEIKARLAKIAERKLREWRLGTWG